MDGRRSEHLPVNESAAAAAAAARDGYGRLVALLAAADGDLAGAEDALADACFPGNPRDADHETVVELFRKIMK